jgi:CTP:molybdopterin cytidylyltransferase MocA
MKKKHSNCSVVILAAGRSSRMKSHKFALKFNKNKSFLDEIIAQYHSFGCKNIIVVMNNEGVRLIKNHLPHFPDGVIFIENKYIEYGRFHSIKLGLEAITNTFPVFIHNVDNPFVNPSVLQKLIAHSTFNFVAPTFKGQGGHPILISQIVKQQIQLEEKNNIILYDFLRRFEKQKIEADDKNILVNINTPEKYENFKFENN